MSSFFKKHILLEWDVLKEWIEHSNKQRTYPWEKQIKRGIIAYLSIFLMLFVGFGNEAGLVRISVLSIFLTLLFILSDTTTMKKNDPHVYISLQGIRIAYFEGRQFIRVSNIISFYFNKFNIDGLEYPVLVLELKKNSVFEIGIPNHKFEFLLRNALSNHLKIPFNEK